MARSLSAASSPACVSSKPVLPVVYLWVKQGKTDHMATLEDPATSSLFYEHQHQQQKQRLTNKNKNKNLDDDDDEEEEEDASRNNSTNTNVNTNIADLFGLDPETEVRIRWSSSNQRDIVDASEIRIRDLEREGRGSERGGRPSRNVTRNATKTSAIITRTNTRQLQRSEKPVVEKRRPKKRKNRRPKKKAKIIITSDRATSRNANRGMTGILSALFVRPEQCLLPTPLPLRCYGFSSQQQKSDEKRHQTLD
eukprot:jgi/Psemu1/47149/gm1.47149_g